MFMSMFVTSIVLHTGTSFGYWLLACWSPTSQLKNMF